MIRVDAGKYGGSLPVFKAICAGCGCEGPAVEGRPLRRGRPDNRDPAFELAFTVSGFRETLVHCGKRRYKTHYFCSKCRCSKCGRGPATACKYCDARLCDYCGEQHDPPDCPPQWQEYLRASIGQPDEVAP